MQPGQPARRRCTRVIPATDRSSIAYRVVRTDDGDPENDYGTFAEPLDVPELTIAAEEIGPSGSDGRACFMVLAVAASTSSDSSDEACTP